MKAWCTLPLILYPFLACSLNLPKHNCQRGLHKIWAVLVLCCSRWGGHFPAARGWGGRLVDGATDHLWAGSGRNPHGSGRWHHWSAHWWDRWRDITLLRGGQWPGHRPIVGPRHGGPHWRRSGIPWRSGAPFSFRTELVLPTSVALFRHCGYVDLSWDHV